MKTSLQDPKIIRAISGGKNFQSEELYKSKASGHKFKEGDKATLIGLEDFPEYNGEEVTISSIRENGSHGRSYYITGRINTMLNWVYEYRLA